MVALCPFERMRKDGEKRSLNTKNLAYTMSGLMGMAKMCIKLLNDWLETSSIVQSVYQ